jgi:iron(III) transport system ATP-binding protein
VHVRAEIRRLQQALGITTVYVTHDQVEAMSMSDEIAIMRDGQIEQIGDPKSLYFRPATQYAAEFIGRANFLPGYICSVQGDRARVAALGREFVIVPRSRVAVGDRVRIMIRPEALGLETAGAADAQGTVRQATFAGTTVDYVVSVDAVDLLVTELASSEKRSFAEGQPVGVRLNPEAMHVISA